jgi:hypothetical protein
VTPFGASRDRCLLWHIVGPLLERSKGSDRAVVMLVAYLDDSGTHLASPLITLAGYVGHCDSWIQFEGEAQEVLQRYNIPILHTVDLHNTDGQFAKWSRDRKTNFVSELYDPAARHLITGASISVQKRTYVKRGQETGLNRNTSALGFCFNILVDRLLRRPLSGPHIKADGISFVIESGNKNNADMVRIFNEVKKIHKLDKELRSIRIADKNHCIAIQLADFLAYYSRRHAVECDKAEEALVPVGILDNVVRKLPHDSFTATDFGK